MKLTAAQESDIAQAEELLADREPEVVKAANFLAFVKVAAIMVMLK